MAASVRSSLTPTTIQCLPICYRRDCDGLRPSWHSVIGADGEFPSLSSVPSCGSLPTASVLRNGLPNVGGPFPLPGDRAFGSFSAVGARASFGESPMEVLS